MARAPHGRGGGTGATRGRGNGRRELRLCCGTVAHLHPQRGVQPRPYSRRGWCTVLICSPRREHEGTVANATARGSHRVYTWAPKCTHTFGGLLAFTMCPDQIDLNQTCCHRTCRGGLRSPCCLRHCYCSSATPLHPWWCPHRQPPRRPQPQDRVRSAALCFETPDPTLAVSGHVSRAVYPAPRACVFLRWFKCACECAGVGEIRPHVNAPPTKHLCGRRALPPPIPPPQTTLFVRVRWPSATPTCTGTCRPASTRPRCSWRSGACIQWACPTRRQQGPPQARCPR